MNAPTYQHAILGSVCSCSRPNQPAAEQPRAGESSGHRDERALDTQVIVMLPDDHMARESLSGFLEAISNDHFEYILDGLDQGWEIDLEEELIQARTPQTLAYSLLSDRTSVRLDSKWSLWVVDELNRLAEEYSDDQDRADAALSLATEIMRCRKSQGFAANDAKLGEEP